MVKAVVGANWGDEGKGKITDMLGKESDIIVRFQGGANAGHTIVNDYGKFALHTAVRRVLQPYDKCDRKRRCAGYSGSYEGNPVNRGSWSPDSENPCFRQGSDGDVLP